MQITKENEEQEQQGVATTEYELRDEGGDLFDSSAGGGAMAYVHGIGAMLPGLESALAGKSQGVDLEVGIPAERGHGERCLELATVISRRHCERQGEVETGMRVSLEGPEGMQVARVGGVLGDELTLDADHPQAGRTLHFHVTVLDVRDATPSGLNHGHVHGLTGHSH